MFVEEIIIRGEVHKFDFDEEPTKEAITTAIYNAVKGIGGRPRDRERKKK
jgi:hypothetical protein